MAGYLVETAAWAAAMLLGLLTGAKLLRRPVPWRALPALGLGVFFVCLTQVPFPDPVTMICPNPAARPNLVPFRMLMQMVRLWHEAPAALLTDRIVATAAANFIICALFGAALVPLTKYPLRVLGLAAALSGTVELAQLTGGFGIFPCPYREFDVDDLIMNVTGAMVGFLVILTLRRGFFTVGH